MGPRRVSGAVADSFAEARSDRPDSPESRLRCRDTVAAHGLPGLPDRTPVAFRTGAHPARAGRSGDGAWSLLFCCCHDREGRYPFFRFA